MIWPTRLAAGRQGIVTKWSERAGAGYGLVIDDGCVALLLGDGTGGLEVVRTETPLLERCWFAVAATYDAATGVATVRQAPVITATNAPVSPLLPVERLTGETSRRAGARPRPRTRRSSSPGGWTGSGRRRPLQREDRAAARAVRRAPGRRVGLRARDHRRRRAAAGPHHRPLAATALHGTTVNTPARAMTGHNWTGREHRFTAAPGEYGAIHFHDDDLDDAAGTSTSGSTCPATWRAASTRPSSRAARTRTTCRSTSGRRATARPHASALLVPTNSYLAYANDNVAVDDAHQELATGRTAILSRHALHLNEHREYGGSLYDLHSDGSGTCYSSLAPADPHHAPEVPPYLRARAGSSPPTCTSSTGSTQRASTSTSSPTRTCTARAPTSSRRYRVVLTGSHPEYCSGDMLDAIEAYLARRRAAHVPRRQRLLLGRRVPPRAPARDRDPPLGRDRQLDRRSAASTTSASTGELGGLWRHLGRPPQKLFGVGFIAQGLDRSTLLPAHARQLRPATPRGSSRASTRAS